MPTGEELARQVEENQNNFRQLFANSKPLLEEQQLDPEEVEPDIQVNLFELIECIGPYEGISALNRDYPDKIVSLEEFYGKDAYDCSTFQQIEEKLLTSDTVDLQIWLSGLCTIQDITDWVNLNGGKVLEYDTYRSEITCKATRRTFAALKRECAIMSIKPF